MENALWRLKNAGAKVSMKLPMTTMERIAVSKAVSMIVEMFLERNLWASASKTILSHTAGASRRTKEVEMTAQKSFV